MQDNCATMKTLMKTCSFVGAIFREQLTELGNMSLFIDNEAFSLIIAEIAAEVSFDDDNLLYKERLYFALVSHIKQSDSEFATRFSLQTEESNLIRFKILGFLDVCGAPYPVSSVVQPVCRGNISGSNVDKALIVDFWHGTIYITLPSSLLLFQNYFWVIIIIALT
jgi:hypothetical protein